MVARARKRKRVAIEVLREVTPTTKEEPKTEERGGFDDHPEQPVLFPSTEETLPAHNRAERGTKRVEEQESNTFDKFSLLTKMRKEMKRRDE